jgi:DNA-binding HxlR family transcriptional regulator
MKNKATRLRHRDVQDVIELISGRWRGEVMATLCKGPKRFSELKTELSPITSKLLIKELRFLELNLMVYSEKSTEAQNSVLYSLSEHGKTIEPVIHALQTWSLQHRSLIFKKLSK